MAGFWWQPVNAPADKPPSRIKRMLRLRFMARANRRKRRKRRSPFLLTPFPPVKNSAEHRSGDDDAYAQDRGGGDDGGGDVFIFDDFLLQIPRRAKVKN